jgi:hypothetical protein
MNATVLAALFLLPGQVSPPGGPTPVTTSPPAPSALPYLADQANPDDPAPTFWFGTEYLLWWTKKAPLPVPLVTLGSGADPFPGVIGQPGTTVLYGGQPVDFGAASGLRLSAGVTLSRDAGLSLEGSWLMLERQSKSFSVASDANGNPVFAQPIIDVATGLPAAEPVSIPNPFGIAGGISVSNTTRLQGGDTNLGWALWAGDSSRLVLLAGFRYLDLLETLTVSTNFQDVSGIPGGGALFFQGVLSTNNATVFATQDRFRASNQFYGGQVGARFVQGLGAFSVSVQGKVALGCTSEVVTISGASSAITPGAPTITVPGGVLALPSNSGRHSQNRFAVVPEGTLTLGWQMTSWLRATVGYNFLYWSDVARPGNQVDLTVNRFLIPTSGQFGLGTGPARPAFNFQNSDYWAQGINFGLQVRF